MSIREYYNQYRVIHTKECEICASCETRIKPRERVSVRIVVYTLLVVLGLSIGLYVAVELIIHYLIA